MRIKAITPIHVGADELSRRQQRYHRLSPHGLHVDLVDLRGDQGVPRALETSADIRRSEALVLEEAERTSPSEYDAVLPDCVLDPGVGTTLENGLPLLGILRLSTSVLMGLGLPFAAVARNQAIADELAARVRDYGWDRMFQGVRVLDLTFDDISMGNSWDAAITEAVAELTEAGAVINGCSAVDVRPGRPGPAIVDPTAAALRAAAVAAETGLLNPALSGAGA